MRIVSNKPCIYRTQQRCFAWRCGGDVVVKAPHGTLDILRVPRLAPVRSNKPADHSLAALYDVLLWQRSCEQEWNETHSASSKHRRKVCNITVGGAPNRSLLLHGARLWNSLPPDTVIYATHCFFVNSKHFRSDSYTYPYFRVFYFKDEDFVGMEVDGYEKHRNFYACFRTARLRQHHSVSHSG